MNTSTSSSFYPTAPSWTIADAVKAGGRDEQIAGLLTKAGVTLAEVSALPLFVLLVISRGKSWKEQEVGEYRRDRTCWAKDLEALNAATERDVMQLANGGQFDRPWATREDVQVDPAFFFLITRKLMEVRAARESAQVEAQLRAAAFAGKDLVRQTQVFAAKERTPSEERKKVRFPDDEDMLVQAKHFIKGEPIDFVDEAPLDVECPASEGEEKKEEEKSEIEVGAKPASFKLRVRSSASSFSAIRVRAAAAAAEEKKSVEMEGAVELASVPAKQARAAMTPLVRVASFSVRPGAPNFSSAGKVPFPKPKRTEVKLHKQRSAGASSFSTLRLLATVAAVDAEAKEAEATPPTKPTTRAALPALKVRVASFAVRPGAPSFGTLGKEVVAAA